MIGRRLGHYQVLARLGAGGMGVVYRARDERLQREVALKVLPEGALADSTSRRQFLFEAQAASRVNHPNVGIVHEFATEGGTDFLVMELVPGETLESRLTSGALAEADVVSIGAQLAEALAALHAHGIAHLDLKPLNIVLTPEGRAKLVDFGLSRRLEGFAYSAAASSAGRLGLAGTMAYMAPERFSSASADPRSDIWSLGVVLYRAATGRMPFEGDDPASLMYAILNREPVPPREFGSGLSAGLDAAIRRALERDPAARFVSASEFCAALRGSVAVPVAVPRLASLAVLPLANLSGDPDQDFFADGMTEALIADLSRLDGVRVISRTSVMSFRGSSRPLPEIARELGVEAVVEGSVTRAGDRVRISARLIEAAREHALWSRSYERPLEDVLALQAEVAGAVAEGIRARLVPGGPTAPERTREAPPEAYELYLRGRHLWNRRTVADVRKAQQLFEEAIARSPSFARAHAGLADAFNMLGDLSAMGPELARRSALAAAERALALDPHLAEAHTSVGFVRTFHEWDWTGAEAAFRHAITEGPGYATAHQWYAELLTALARFDEAESHARRALELDPLSFVLHTTLGDALYFSRRYEDAIATLEATLELSPDFVPVWMDLGRVLSQLGRHDESLASFRRADEMSGGLGRARSGLAHALARAGRADEARAMLPALESRVASGAVTSHAIAVIRLELGEREAALDWLGRGLRDRDRAMVWLAVHPRVDALRGEPRFKRVLDAMRLEGATTH